MIPTDVKIPSAFRELFKPARYKAYFGGRGSAKSWSFAIALLILGGQKPLRILCCREVQQSIKDSVKQLLDDQIDALGLRGFYVSTQSEIRNSIGTSIIFAGLGKMTTDQIKSMEGIDIAWVEEAQTISKGSLEILDPTIRRPGSELWFSWNPRNASDPVDEYFRGPIKPPEAIIHRVNYNDNPFFPEVLDKIRRFHYEHQRDRYGHIWLGDYEPMAVGAIWDRATLHQVRVTEPPPLERIVVAVDHATSSNPGSNEHGIIVAGMGDDQHGYVLGDYTTTGSPSRWANRAIAAYDRYQADAIVIEKNQGGDLVRNTLEAVRDGLNIVEVWASRGKHVRAEPISALYTLGRVHHVGTFEELEDQMCQITAAGYEGEGSPDRTDALVWALTELFPQMVEKTDIDYDAISPLSEPGDGMGQHGYMAG